MTVIDRARKYLESMPPAISGQRGHDQTFSAACALVHGFGLHDGDAFVLLSEYNQRCVPPWTERELNHKISSAKNSTHAKPRGHLVGDSNGSTNGHHSVRLTPPTPAPAAINSILTNTKKYDSSKRLSVPAPMDDATRRFLLAAFQPGEHIAMADAVPNDRDGKSIPKGSGTTATREEWIARLDKHEGDPNKIFTEQKCGAFIRVNPVRKNGKSDGDVTVYRHALVEFDSLSIDDQFSIIKQSGAPCAAILHSGGRSVHAWVRVDAENREEYDSRVAWIYSHFAQYGVDPKNKNPSRFSRLVGVNRGKERQSLLELNSGAESWAQWQAQVEAQSLGELVTMRDLLGYSPESDINSVLGQRWLCKGGSCIWVGQSGIGKSSLSVQAALCWGMGLDFFGIKATYGRPLKSLIIQAENDLGDVAEMVQGVNEEITNKINGSAPGKMNEFARLAVSNIVFVRNQVHTGERFCQTLSKLIEIHKPDIVWVDPLLAFFGEDISNQKACSQFLRNWLNPILESSGVVLMLMHHTNKPEKDSKSKAAWTRNDFSYAGTGSSELTNWARAVVVLREIGDEVFRLSLTKRGKRAQAKAEDETYTSDIWLRHADRGIAWVQTDEPQKEEGGRPKKEITEDMVASVMGNKQLKWWQVRQCIKGVIALSDRQIDSRKDEIRRYLSYDKQLAVYELKEKHNAETNYCRG